MYLLKINIIAIEIRNKEKPLEKKSVYFICMKFRKKREKRH